MNDDLSTTRRAADDEGASLIMALVFVMVIGLLSSALLTQASAQFKANTVFKERRQATLAADAGIEYALETAGLQVPVIPAPTTCVAPAPTGGGGPNPAPPTCPMTPKFLSKAATALVNTTLNLAVPQPANTNRALVVAVYTTTGSVGTVTFGPTSGTGVGLQPMPSSAGGGRGSTLQYFYALDSQLPATVGAGATYSVKVPSGFTGSYHAALFYGVKQDALDQPYGPKVTPGPPTASPTSTITTNAEVLVANSVVFSFAAHRHTPGFLGICSSPPSPDVTAPGVSTPTGFTALNAISAGGNCGTGATNAYHLALPKATATPFTSNFGHNGDPTQMGIFTMYPAAFGGTEVAAAGCATTPLPIETGTYNGFTVNVECTPVDEGQFTITSTATGPTTHVSTAHVTVDADIGVEIDSWDSRPG